MDDQFDRLGRKNRWTLSEGRLTLHHPMMDVFWEVPEDYSMPSMAVLGLAEYVFLTPFKENVELEPPSTTSSVLEYDNNIPTVDGRQNVGVAFSGGIDSTAVLHLLPSCIPIYTQVHRPTGMHKIENAILSVKEVGGVAIVSNCDELPKAYGK